MGLEVDPPTAGYAVSSRVRREMYPPIREGRAVPRDAQPQPVAQAGFGKGTISQTTAAVVTLGRGLQSARHVVPTVDELRDAVRVRVSEARERQRVEDDARTERHDAIRGFDRTSRALEVWERDPAIREGPDEPARSGVPDANPPTEAEPAPGSRLNLLI
jgi:hypothetical protein